METNVKYIDAGVQDMDRPSERPPKTNWKIELIKKALSTLQYISPQKTSEIVWYYFTRPGKAKFKASHHQLLNEAETSESFYKGNKIVSYTWGNSGPKVLLVHGWRSKVADFRRMIDSMVEKGFTVEGLDMKAHGHSEGSSSSLPEFRDLVKNHCQKYGPYEAIIGYSLGGTAAGMAVSELEPNQRPKQLYLIASPPYIQYFFHDTIQDLGYSEAVFQEMCDLVEKYYGEPISYFDLRVKQEELSNIELHLIYDEQDQTVPFEKGHELRKQFPKSQFVHTKGLGHYKVIAYDEVINHIIETITITSEEES